MEWYLPDVVMAVEGLCLPASGEQSSMFIIKGIISCGLASLQLENAPQEWQGGV